MELDCDYSIIQGSVTKRWFDMLFTAFDPATIYNIRGAGACSHTHELRIRTTCIHAARVAAGVRSWRGDPSRTFGKERRVGHSSRPGARTRALPRVIGS